MKLSYFLAILLIIPITFCSVYGSVNPQRSKRWLIFPPTAPTRVQFIYGFGVPLEGLTREAMTTGYVLKGEYLLPDNASQLISDDFPWPNAPEGRNGRKTRATIESSRNAASKLGEQFETTRWAVYKAIEMVLQKSGMIGRPCLLMSICEAANVPFTYRNGLLGEMLHVVLSPSTTEDKLTDHSDNEYLRAEQLGKTGAPCGRMFSECNHSILNIIGGVFDPMNAIKMLFG